MACTRSAESRKRFGLSRSTLLYYDRIGLLRPSGRTRAEYRQYSEKDVGRLEQICQYREAGVPLAEIRKILQGPGTELARVLEERLVRINDEVRRLRDQQRVILGLLQKRDAHEEGRRDEQGAVDRAAAGGRV